MTENNQFACRYNDKNGKVEIIDLIKDEHYPMTETVVKGLVDCLNELFDENEQLKYTLSAYMVDLNNCKGKCSALEIENEHLKQSLKNKMESDAYWEVKAKERVTELEQRNKNQKRRLEKIHQMVSDENWEGLKLHYEKLKEQDEQYSKEERLYYCDGDIND